LPGEKLYIQNLNGWNQAYLNLFAVFFNKILIKYIFGIMEYSDFGILHLLIIIVDSRMGVFSTKYIGTFKK